MLTHLQIENYALIRKLDTRFYDGLTVITGETGAGKSILLGALSLILGERADTKVLNDKTGKCIIEGAFNLESKNLRDLFEQHDLDYDDISYFRREITPSGKSRAFINDTPVNLTIMRTIAGQLIDIHSQHESLMLGSSSFQFDVVDAYAQQLSAVFRYREKYRQYRQKQQELTGLIEKERQARADLDYYQYQYDELEKAQLDAAEYRLMEEQVSILRHAGEIRFNAEKARYLLQDADQNVLDMLHEVKQLIEPLARFGETWEELTKRIESLHIETDDIARETNRICDDIEHDPEEATRLEARMDDINNLMLKHSAASIDELITTRKGFKQKIASTISLADQVEVTGQEVETLKEELEKQATDISGARKKAIPEIEKEVTGLVKMLGMPGARFYIRQEEMNTLSPNGTDALSFLFNANVGGELQEIARIASGGELSRVMMAVKNIISQKNVLPTIIFDEIDTGISGETTNQVAGILGHMARNMQVIAITHLPQVAAKGHTHLLVYKAVENGQTQTRLEQLDDKQRVMELAKMLGGEKPSKHMVETAKELIFNKEN